MAQRYNNPEDDNAWKEVFPEFEGDDEPTMLQFVHRIQWLERCIGEYKAYCKYLELENEQLKNLNYEKEIIKL